MEHRKDMSGSRGGRLSLSSNIGLYKLIAKQRSNMIGLTPNVQPSVTIKLPNLSKNIRCNVSLSYDFCTFSALIVKKRIAFCWRFRIILLSDISNVFFSGIYAWPQHGICI